MRDYDDWYRGRGPFAGLDRPGWDDEVRELAGILAALPPARTLDVACGTGFLTQHIQGDITGLDQSERRLEIARLRLPGATLLTGDALDLPFPDESFDRVFAGHFYGHLDQQERERFVAEARRVAPEMVLVDSASDDGSEWEVHRRYFRAWDLAEELGAGRAMFQGRWFVVVVA